jgi:hypothetical protein
MMLNFELKQKNSSLGPGRTKKKLVFYRKIVYKADIFVSDDI